MGSIIHSLRSNFLDSQENIELHSVNEMLISIKSLIEPQCKNRNIDFQLEIPLDLKASFRPDEMRQVLLNVIGNSIHILESIVTKPRIIKITANKKENFVYLTISDSGPGVSSKMRSTLFELLTTSKSKKESMGLGLWLSKYILTKSGGDIQYQQIDGWGATFQIQLPIEFQQSASIGGGLKLPN
jgi:C4-dicarboxylate-specific signal transduction histidine kinase